jgi:hypothetical protein
VDSTFAERWHSALIRQYDVGLAAQCIVDEMLMKWHHASRTPTINDGIKF